ncbi:MAG: hypothetical protein IPK17_00650 [Chloroflexi bacterium]|uniref:hypothetical protein n=1 Tax=Candidatus Flexifilum breve TaxID=3140694 RepID=UPI003134D831|nr:hypothetical protein [Chloroflexota bacterium]
MKKLLLVMILLLIAVSAVSGRTPSPCGCGRIRKKRLQRGPATIIDAYEAAHPNVSIELETFEYELYIQTLQTAPPAGNEADILEPSVRGCSYSDRLAPMPAGLVDTSVF